MDKIPEEMAGPVVRVPWIKYQKRGWHCGEGSMDKIPEERAGTVVRVPWIKYQKRGLALW
jgi:hypothetical protein